MISTLSLHLTTGEVVEVMINESSPMAEQVCNDWIDEYEKAGTLDYYDIK